MVLFNRPYGQNSLRMPGVAGSGQLVIAETSETPSNQRLIPAPLDTTGFYVYVASAPPVPGDFYFSIVQDLVRRKQQSQAPNYIIDVEDIIIPNPGLPIVNNIIFDKALRTIENLGLNNLPALYFFPLNDLSAPYFVTSAHSPATWIERINKVESLFNRREQIPPEGTTVAQIVDETVPKPAAQAGLFTGKNALWLAIGGLALYLIIRKSSNSSVSGTPRRRRRKAVELIEDVEVSSVGAIEGVEPELSGEPETIGELEDSQ